MARTYNKTSSRDLRSAMAFPTIWVLVLWLVQLVKYLFDLNFVFLGTKPRTIEGLIGILTSPFIHGDFIHLLSNSVPLFIATTLILLVYREVAYKVIIFVSIATGIAVWLLARGEVWHIGASGVVYGLVSYIFFTGVFDRNVQSIVLSLIMLFLYSGMLAGIVPGEEGISWESHLLGGFVGFIAAFLFKGQLEQPLMRNPWDIKYEEEEDKVFFLPRDTFDDYFNKTN